MNPETAMTKDCFRVLMYTAYFDPEYSGAALQALTLARELRRRGHHIEFVTNRWAGLAERGEVEGFKVWRLEPGRLRKHRELRLWYNLARLVWWRRQDFDILHSHGAYYTHAFIGPLGRLTGLKTLAKASLAHDDLQDLDRPLIGWLHRLMLRRIDACVAISEDLAQEFRAGGVDPARIRFLPNGVDTERFRPAAADARPALRATLGLPAERPIALYIGVLDERKNILWLAEQWVAHRGFGSGALLVAVGPQSREDTGGVLRGRLERLSHDAPELFQLRDFTPDIVPWYQSADVLVLPSLKEGLPNVVLEAMACGLPCVAARASGSRELIVQAQTGFTYEHGQAMEMAAAIKRCLGPEGRAMGENARHQVEARYSIRSIADRYEALYAQLLGLGTTPPPAQPAHLPDQSVATSALEGASDDGRPVLRRWDPKGRGCPPDKGGGPKGRGVIDSRKSPDGSAVPPFVAPARGCTAFTSLGRRQPAPKLAATVFKGAGLGRLSS